MRFWDDSQLDKNLFKSLKEHLSIKNLPQNTMTVTIEAEVENHIVKKW